MAADTVGYRIFRNSELLAQLPLAQLTTFDDTDPPAGSVVYEIAVLTGWTVRHGSAPDALYHR